MPWPVSSATSGRLTSPCDSLSMEGTGTDAGNVGMGREESFTSFESSQSSLWAPGPDRSCPRTLIPSPRRKEYTHFRSKLHQGQQAIHELNQEIQEAPGSRWEMEGVFLSRPNHSRSPGTLVTEARRVDSKPRLPSECLGTALGDTRAWRILAQTSPEVPTLPLRQSGGSGYRPGPDDRQRTSAPIRDRGSDPPPRG